VITGRLRYPGKRKQNTIFALVERDGKVKSTHITGKNFFNIKKAFKNHLDTNANLTTDEHKKFCKIGQQYASHEAVNRGRKEYARGHVNANTIEGVFSIFKRGMTGIYQHCDSKHLHRYLLAKPKMIQGMHFCIPWGFNNRHRFIPYPLSNRRCGPPNGPNLFPLC